MAATHLAHLQGWRETNTPGECYSSCLANNFTFASVNGGVCSCGNTSLAYARVAASLCSGACPGAGGQVCGGPSYTVVAGPGYPATPATCSYAWLLPSFQPLQFMVPRDLTPATCMARCAAQPPTYSYTEGVSRRFQYAGVGLGDPYGGCLCGTSLPEGVEVVGEAWCHQPCPGDPGLRCGGDSFVSVYKLDT